MQEKEIMKAIELVRKYQSETNRIEVKRAALDIPKKCYDTISSFSNKDGGIIIFKIDEENNFCTEGVYDIKDLQSKISSFCCDAMEPVVRPEFLSMEFEGKMILGVKIEEIAQAKKPCYYKPKGLNKVAYIRVGDRDEVMTSYEIYALESYNNGIREDLRPNKRSTLEDLDEEELNHYIEKNKIRKAKFC